MIPASHFIWVIQAEREEQMRRSHMLLAARSAGMTRPSIATRLISALRTHGARGAAFAGRPHCGTTCTAVCC